MRILNNWRRGVVPPSGRKLQQGVDAMRQLQNRPAMHGPDQERRIIFRGLGTVNDKGPNGETYAPKQTSPDERHWVQLGYIKSGNVWDSIQLSNDVLLSPSIVYCTNLPDLANHSHSLSKGQIVDVWAEVDRGSPSKAHWFCSAGAGRVLVKLSNATTFTPVGGSPITLGGGRYVGTIYNLPTSDATLSSNLADADFGTAGATCLLYNVWESGQSTRSLVTTAGTYPQFFFGFPLKPYSDGTPVFAIDGIQWGC